MRWCVRVGVLVWCGSATAVAQNDRALAELSLQELAEIEVTSVAKKQQKLSRVPAAVFVLTSEDIRRSGATSIPEALRLVPGVQVARLNAHEWAISVRGFNSRWSNKLLVMMDGRTVYTPSFSGVYWDVQDTVLEDIERIEVIRGPGATMWGANAVNGIINILTKTARDTHGGLAEVAAGNEDHAIGGVRYGARLGEHRYGRAYARYTHRDPARRAIRGGFRGDWELSARDSVTLQGDLYTSRSETDLQAYGAAPGETRSSGGNLLGRWRRIHSDNRSSELQVYYDYYRRRDLMSPESMGTVDVDFHQQAGVGRHGLQYGGNLRLSDHQSDSSPITRLEQPARKLWRTSAFLQDELTLVPDRLLLTVGTKIERNTLGGGTLQPGAQVAWTPDNRRTVWFSLARAVRDPSRYETGLRVLPVPGPYPGVWVDTSGNPNIRPEKLLATEAGARWQPSAKVSLDLAAFHNLYRDLQSLEAGAPRFETAPVPRVVMPVWFDNGLEGRTFGAELAASFQPLARWRLMTSYSWLRMRLRRKPGSTAVFASEFAGEAPEHQGTLRSWLDLSRTVSFDATLYLTDRLPAQRVAGYARADARLAWRPVAPLELSLTGQNLGGRRRAEFIPVQDRVFQSGELGRAAYVRLAWHF